MPVGTTTAGTSSTTARRAHSSAVVITVAVGITARTDPACGARVVPAPRATAAPVAQVGRALPVSRPLRLLRLLRRHSPDGNQARIETNRPLLMGRPVALSATGIIGIMTVRSPGALVGLAMCAWSLVVPAAAGAKPSDPGVVSYAVLGKGSVGNVIGAPMGWEAGFTAPFQGYFVDLPVCNNWGDIGLPEVYNDPDLASFNGATTQTAATDDSHLVKQAVGVFATVDAAARAYHRIVDRTGGCSGQSTAMHLDDGRTQVWSFSGTTAGADLAWVKQEAGTDRRCFVQTRLRENVLLQAKVCQSGNGGPAVNVLAGAMQNTLAQ